ncbi:MAG: hypothetical protein DRJ60_00420 [Thermoprotei archaeon]|nr:MAG: hypothetical protein DRJ60_00420 [Thermoprotei archaeon]
MSWIGLRHKGVEILFPEEWNAVVDGLDILYAYTNMLQATAVRKEDLTKLASDIVPDQDNLRDLGSSSRSWSEVYAYYGYFKSDAYIQGKRVLKDGDPVITKQFIDEAKLDVDKIYNLLTETKVEVKDLETKLVEDLESRLEPKLDLLEVYMQDVYSKLFEVKSKIITVEEKTDFIKKYIQDVYFQTRLPTGVVTYWLDVGVTPIPLSDIDRYVKKIHIKVPSWALYFVYLGNKDKQDFILEAGDKETLEFPNPKQVYVRSLGNVVISVMLEQVEVLPINASGLDPNDPTWAPATGWEKIWEFRSPDELNDFATSMMYAAVENDMLIFKDIPSGEYGDVLREVLDVVKSHMAMAIKLNVEALTNSVPVAAFLYDDGTNMYIAYLFTDPSDPSILWLYEYGASATATFVNPNDWFVFCVDIENKVAKVYDKNKQLLAQISLSALPSSRREYAIGIHEENSSIGITDVAVDWVAVA